MTPVLHHDRVDEHGHAWVDAGLITDDQLAAIRHVEDLDDASTDTDARGGRRFSVAAEIAVYLGSVLAVTGGGLVVAARWDDLAFAARLAVALAVLAVGVCSGAWSYRQGEPGTARVGGFLTAVGLGGLAFTIGLVVDRLDPRADEVVVIVSGLFVIAAGLVAWRNRPRPLELLVVLAAFLFVAMATASWLDVGIWTAGAAAVIMGSAVAIGGGAGIVHPNQVAIAGGAFLAYVGTFTLSEVNEHLGPAAALVVALAVVVHATRTDTVPLLVLGVLGALLATEAVLATTFDGALAASLVALVGLAIVVTVLVRAGRGAGRTEHA